MNLKETKDLLSRYKINPAKSLGQNFLTDESVQSRILDEIGLIATDLVIEIGPGAGVLSGAIAGRCTRLILIEIDRQLIPLLEERFAGDVNIVIVHADALEVDYHELVRRNLAGLPPETKVKVVSNLPYYITTPLITRLICEIPECERLVFTLQEEAAARIMSQPDTSDYCVLSVLSQYLYKLSIAAHIPASCFYPQPNVESVVMRMQSIPGISITSKEIHDFEKFIKAAYGQRRKTLSNSLASSYHLAGGKESVENALAIIGLNKAARAQELTPSAFRSIYLHLKSLNAG
ncbi:MAG: 16S rRNA (adenine(1518)-N(6)/adenine(1519)-N(6))-dimethyltransferase RsmA [Saccharofermentanales bacterium]